MAGAKSSGEQRPAPHGGGARSAPARSIEPRLLSDCPSPVLRLGALELPQVELWLKNDGALNPLYGGNKVRKLQLILPKAVRRGAHRLVTLGAAGSHHVLATCVFGRELGLPVAAVLTRQPWSAHAEQVLRASIACGLQPHPAQSMPAAGLRLSRLLRRGDYLIPVGGSSVTGAVGYALAVAELKAQIHAGALPEPDVIVAALGSGGTVAGLLAGVAREGLRSRVLGVSVAFGAWAARAVVVPLAYATTRRLGSDLALPRLSALLLVDARQLGRGYGYPTQSGMHAARLARQVGLALDPTYTAKAFAGALSVSGMKLPPDGRSRYRQMPEIAAISPGDRPLRVLYWHTLSASPLGPLLATAPSSIDLSARLRSLLHAR